MNITKTKLQNHIKMFARVFMLVAQGTHRDNFAILSPTKPKEILEGGIDELCVNLDCW
jgi:hypothetical protein